MNELALFAGAGGGILAGHLLGWRTVCAVEIEDYPRRVLLQRQADGFLPRFPIWDNICTFDGKPWRGKIDVISGGFPCQDLSAAGKGKGLDGERSGLWREMARVICEVQPRYAFIENSPMLTVRGLDRVLCDLAQMGFDAQWGVVGAADVGAPHKRDRIWIVAHSPPPRHLAHTNSIRRWRWNKHKQSERDSSRESFSVSSEIISGEMAYTNSTYGKRNQCTKRIIETRAEFDKSSWWSVEPKLGRVADGVADRVHRLKAIGNGQVPLCAATAWRILNE